MTRMSYGDYLQLDRLLSAQRPLSDAHDELLFIVIHQASELWLKLCLHELRAARQHIIADDLRPAFKMMARVARAQEGMIRSWEVLATMTPADYTALRGRLGTSSGFQSGQYRALEYLMGARDKAKLAVFDDEPETQAMLADELTRPSLYRAALDLLARRGLAVPEAALARPLADSHEPDPAIEACWRAVYAEPERLWDLYELAEKLVDLEYHVQLWRFGHLKTVERVIGMKTGTGGTAGVAYLRGVLDGRFFPELLSVRTAM
jgi:tryptophan 2,3-dioxygenase